MSVVLTFANHATLLGIVALQVGTGNVCAAWIRPVSLRLLSGLWGNSRAKAAQNSAEPAPGRMRVSTVNKKELSLEARILPRSEVSQPEAEPRTPEPRVPGVSLGTMEGRDLLTEILSEKGNR
jgi:hypothetical protein